MIRHPTAVMLLVTAAMAFGAVAAQAQQIRGRVVDEWSRLGIVDATVTLHVSGDTALVDRVGSDADGFFTVRTRGPGEYRVQVERIGYTAVERTITVGSEAELTVPAFVLVSRAVRLDPIVAEGRPRSILPGMAGGGLRGTNVLAGGKLAAVERSGVSMSAAVRRLRAGLRVRHLSLPGGRTLMCIESIRGMPSFRSGGGGTGCNMVTIVLDGMTLQDPLGYFQYLDVSQFESMEFLLPSEATMRFGMAAGTSGALVLWTRGRGPYRSNAR